MDEPIGPAGVPQAWLNSQVTVAWPNRLSDSEFVWTVLMRGVLKQVEAVDSDGLHGRVFELFDVWSQTISQPLASVWQLKPDASLIAQSQGSFMAGPEGNRSEQRYTVNGGQAYVIQSGSGLNWTVLSTLETLSVSAGLGLVLIGVPRETAEADLDDTIDLSKPLAGILEDILDRYGLVIQRDITRQGGTILEDRVVRPIKSGRPIRVVWANSDRPLGDALKVSVDRPAQPAQLWTVRADGWLVESTFELVAGWDPALEGQADDEYDEGLSSDFAIYADVYRNWVLNEDGFYSLPPYNRGPAYNLAQLFGESSVDAQSLTIQSNITLDDTGEPLEPIVEMSIDSGLNWSIYPKSSSILNDRAGVYLDSVSLPTTFLDAAKSGGARLRVTASLRNPVPVMLSRWSGNAFAANLPPLVFDRSKTHFFRRVDVNSIHYDDIHAGSITSSEVDDSHRLLDWLVKRLGQRTQGGRATLELVGAWPLLRPGDSLREVRGPGIAADGQSQALTRRGAWVVDHETVFVAQSGTSCTTRIDLKF